jgi:hypothetical protein
MEILDIVPKIEGTNNYVLADLMKAILIFHLFNECIIISYF